MWASRLPAGVSWTRYERSAAGGRKARQWLHARIRLKAQRLQWPPGILHPSLLVMCRMRCESRGRRRLTCLNRSLDLSASLDLALSSLASRLLSPRTNLKRGDSCGASRLQPLNSQDTRDFRCVSCALPITSGKVYHQSNCVGFAKSGSRGIGLIRWLIRLPAQKESQNPLSAEASR